MKKLLFLSLLLSAVFCLSSCGSDSDDNDAVAYIENPVLGKVAVDITNTETTPGILQQSHEELALHIQRIQCSEWEIGSGIKVPVM